MGELVFLLLSYADNQTINCSHNVSTVSFLLIITASHIALTLFQKSLLVAQQKQFVCFHFFVTTIRAGNLLFFKKKKEV